MTYQGANLSSPVALVGLKARGHGLGRVAGYLGIRGREAKRPPINPGKPDRDRSLGSPPQLLGGGQTSPLLAAGGFLCRLGQRRPTIGHVGLVALTVARWRNWGLIWSSRPKADHFYRFSSDGDCRSPSTAFSRSIFVLVARNNFVFVSTAARTLFAPKQPASCASVPGLTGPASRVDRAADTEIGGVRKLKGGTGDASRIGEEFRGRCRPLDMRRSRAGWLFG
jgi:hypothetical protein